MNGPHKLKEPMVKDDMDRIADLIWFLKGWLHADFAGCPFGGYHIEALRKARANLLPHVLTDEELPF